MAEDAPWGVVELVFRREAGRMLAALARVLGLHNLEVAEDVVQEILCHALEVWKYHPLPDEPAAWLMRAARNRAIDHIRQQKVRQRFAPDVSHHLETEWSLVPTVEALFAE